MTKLKVNARVKIIKRNLEPYKYHIITLIHYKHSVHVGLPLFKKELVNNNIFYPPVRELTYMPATQVSYIIIA